MIIYNPGTIGKPLRTLQKAFYKTAENGTIHLAEGTYTITEDTELQQNNLTIIGANRDKTMINGNNKVQYLRNDNNEDSLRLENLTITQFVGMGIGSGYLTARNCIFTQNEDILQCGDAFIDHCLFKENHGTLNGGILDLYCKGTKGGDYRDFDTRTTVINCDFKNNTGTTILCNGARKYGVNIVNCNFINQQGLCIQFLYGEPYPRDDLGNNYWDGATQKKDILKKMEGTNAFYYKISETPLDNGYNNY